MLLKQSTMKISRKAVVKDDVLYGFNSEKKMKSSFKDDGCGDSLFKVSVLLQYMHICAYISVIFSVSHYIICGAM